MLEYVCIFIQCAAKPRFRHRAGVLVIKSKAKSSFVMASHGLSTHVTFLVRVALFPCCPTATSTFKNFMHLKIWLEILEVVMMNDDLVMN